LEVPTLHVDLLSLELDEDDVKHVDVRCRRCESGVRFWINSTDPLKSVYRCNGDTWTCGVSWTWYDLHWGSMSDKLHHFFYTEAPIPQEELWKMKLEEHNGTTAYHYLVKATWEERLGEAVKRLEILRAKVKRIRGG
jgi:hypothetical protein